MFSLLGYNGAPHSGGTLCLMRCERPKERPQLFHYNILVTITEMSIQIKLFANLAESVGKRSGTIEHSDGLTVASLWRDFTGEEEIPNGVLCAVNFDYAELDQELNDGDEIAFFPPVTGG